MGRERETEKGKAVRFKLRKEVAIVAAISSGKVEGKAHMCFSDTLLVKVSRDQQRDYLPGTCQTCRIAYGLYLDLVNQNLPLTYPLVTVMHIKV